MSINIFDLLMPLFCCIIVVTKEIMSYDDIITKCKFKDYTEALFRIETWESATHIFQCFWLSQNEGRLPTTISYKLK